MSKGQQGYSALRPFLRKLGYMILVTWSHINGCQRLSVRELAHGTELYQTAILPPAEALREALDWIAEQVKGAGDAPASAEDTTPPVASPGDGFFFPMNRPFETVVFPIQTPEVHGAVKRIKEILDELVGPRMQADVTTPPHDPGYCDTCDECKRATTFSEKQPCKSCIAAATPGEPWSRPHYEPRAAEAEKQTQALPRTGATVTISDGFTHEDIVRAIEHAQRRAVPEQATPPTDSQFLTDMICTLGEKQCRQIANRFGYQLWVDEFCPTGSVGRFRRCGSNPWKEASRAYPFVGRHWRESLLRDALWAAATDAGRLRLGKGDAHVFLGPLDSSPQSKSTYPSQVPYKTPNPEGES